MRLTVMNETLAVCRLAPEALIPDWLTGGWQSVTRTAEELDELLQ